MELQNGMKGMKDPNMLNNYYLFCEGSDTKAVQIFLTFVFPI